MVTLAVNEGWSPVGETAHTLISKIQNLNALNQVDTKRVFLSSDQVCFKHTDMNKASFDFKGIFNSTGWTKEMLELSFTDAFPCLTNIGHLGNYATIEGWHNKLRICPECLIFGVHLIFHQSKIYPKRI